MLKNLNTFVAQLPIIAVNRTTPILIPTLALAIYNYVFSQSVRLNEVHTFSSLHELLE